MPTAHVSVAPAQRAAALRGGRGAERHATRQRVASRPRRSPCWGRCWSRSASTRSCRRPATVAGPCLTIARSVAGPTVVVASELLSLGSGSIWSPATEAAVDERRRAERDRHGRAELQRRRGAAGERADAHVTTSPATVQPAGPVASVTPPGSLSVTDHAGRVVRPVVGDSPAATSTTPPAATVAGPLLTIDRSVTGPTSTVASSLLGSPPPAGSGVVVVTSALLVCEPTDVASDDDARRSPSRRRPGRRRRSRSCRPSPCTRPRRPTRTSGRPAVCRSVSTSRATDGPMFLVVILNVAVPASGDRRRRRPSSRPSRRRSGRRRHRAASLLLRVVRDRACGSRPSRCSSVSPVSVRVDSDRHRERSVVRRARPCRARISRRRPRTCSGASAETNVTPAGSVSLTTDVLRVRGTVCWSTLSVHVYCSPGTYLAGPSFTIARSALASTSSVPSSSIGSGCSSDLTLARVRQRRAVGDVAGDAHRDGDRHVRAGRQRGDRPDDSSTRSPSSRRSRSPAPRSRHRRV